MALTARITRPLAAALALAALLGSALPNAAQAAPTSPLYCGSQSTLTLYYSDARRENFTTATAAGAQSALDAGYRFVRTEGDIWWYQAAGTVPLKLYYSDARHDNFTTATAAGEQSALAAGYRFVRTEGYVSPDYSAYTPYPIRLYYSDARGDNFITTTAQGEQDALAAGYRFVRVEGYVSGPCHPH